MRQHLQAGNQVILFLNRRGFAPALLCHDCGWIAECRAATTTTPSIRPSAICAATTATASARCRVSARRAGQRTSCRSVWALNSWNRPGAVLPGRAHFPNRQGHHQPQRGAGTAVGRSASRWRAHPDWHPDAGQRSPLPGRDAGCPAGCRWRTVLCRFPLSRAFCPALYPVAGRAGRAGKQGEVVLQTHHPEHPLLQTLLHKGYDAFAEQALAERQTMQLPRGPAT